MRTILRVRASWIATLVLTGSLASPGSAGLGGPAIVGANASKPPDRQASEPLAVAGLHARVTVRRDALGTPFIEAGDEHDLFLAQGYVTAGDRLWQMDLLRRTIRGELAEILGKTVLDQDVEMRVLGFGPLAEGLAQRVSPRMQDALSAYAEGVNAYIASCGTTALPVEFGILGYAPKPWRPADSLVVGKLFSLGLTTSWPTDVMRASLADLPAERRAALLPETSPLDVVLVGEVAPPGGAGKSPARSRATPTPANGATSSSKAGLAQTVDPGNAPARVGQSAASGTPSLPKTPAGIFEPGPPAEGPRVASFGGWRAANPPALGGAAAGLKALAAPGEPAEARQSAATIARIASERLRSALGRLGVGAHGLLASNNWVISGRRSVTGKPLLANDPHLPPSAPSIWYMTHLAAPGIRVSGVSAPGTIGILIGHNERIAWGVTNLMADVQDLYVEKFDPSGRYATPAGERTPEVRKERILVRSEKSDGDPGTVDSEVVVTRHGPIVVETNGARLALRWTALDADACELSAFFDIDHAGSWKEFVSALARFPGPPLNFVYADIAGHIGYYAAGRIPVRASGDGSVPCDGASDACEWRGYLPIAEMPHLFDPPSGSIVTANNRIVGSGYRHLITRAWGVPYRARRITDLLAQKPKLSAEDFQAIQKDAYSYADAIFARAVVEVAKAEESRHRATGEGGGGAVTGQQEWSEMIRTFEGWDGRASETSRVLPLAVEMRRAFVKKVLASALGAERASAYEWPNRDTLIDEIVTTRPDAWLPKESSSWADLFLASWNEARSALTGLVGADETLWTWGRVGEPVRFPHPLGDFPLVGAPFTIAPLPKATEGSGETVDQGSNVSMRFVADLSDWDRTRLGIAPGESGDPSSPHWSDQIAGWRAGATALLPFSSRAVERAAVETRILVPAGIRDANTATTRRR